MKNQRDQTKLTKAGLLAALTSFRWLIIFSLLFVLAAGTIRVPRFWIFAGILFVGSMISAFLMIKLSPELANKRGKSQKGTKKWDLFLIVPYVLILIIINPLVAALDTVRFQWSSLGFSSLYIGIVLYVISFIIMTWAMMTNKHFEGTVRIQEDRGHRVISHGPYKFIRHPGYLAMILNSFAVPLMLGSLFTFIPVGISLILLLIRTSLEDKTLRNELSGYKEYSQKIKYRLVPFIW